MSGNCTLCSYLCFTILPLLRSLERFEKQLDDWLAKDSAISSNPSFPQVTGELSDLQVAGGGSGWRRWLSGDIIIPIIGLFSNLMLGRLFIMLDSLRKDIIMRDVMASTWR